MRTYAKKNELNLGGVHLGLSGHIITERKNKMKVLMVSMFCFLLLISFLWGVALSQSRDRRRLLKWFFYYQFLFCLLYVVLDCVFISIQRIV